MASAICRGFSVKAGRTGLYPDDRNIRENHATSFTRSIPGTVNDVNYDWSLTPEGKPVECKVMRRIHRSFNHLEASMKNYRLWKRLS